MCTSTLVALLACLASVSALPPTFLAYNVERGEKGGTTLLDCIEDTSNTYRCRPLRQRSRNSFPAARPKSLPLEMLQEAQRDMEAMDVFEKAAPAPLQEAEAAVEASFTTRPGQEASKSPRCEVYKIYVPELDRCVDLIEHLMAPKMTDPRLARWYSWRNSIFDARMRAKGF